MSAYEDSVHFQLGLQSRLEHADRLPIDVVDRRCGKQQAADHPSGNAEPHLRRLTGQGLPRSKSGF